MAKLRFYANLSAAGSVVAAVSFTLHNTTSGAILVKADSREAAGGKPELVLTP